MVSARKPTARGRRSSISGTAPATDMVYALKFTLVGSPGVGKTRLWERILHDRHAGGGSRRFMQLATRTIRYAENSCVRAQVWDTAGEFPSKVVTEAFFRGTAGAMLVYDISRRSTFDDLARWLALVREHCHNSIAVVLVGNKSDMSSKQREVSMMEGMRFARKHGLDFLEASALHAEHVEEACRQLVVSVARYLPQEKCTWSKKPSCPLPAGWVPIHDALGGGPGRSRDGPPDGGDEENADPYPGGAAVSHRYNHRPAASGEKHIVRIDSYLDIDDSDVDTDSDDSGSTGAATIPLSLPPSPSLTTPMPPPPPPRFLSPTKSIPVPRPPSRTSKVFAADHRSYHHHNSNSNSHHPQGRQERHLRASSDSSAAAAAVATTAGSAVAFGGGGGDFSVGSSAVVRPAAGRLGKGEPPRGRGSFESAGPERAPWYENIWTGERVSRRPMYPAGPSDACVVSQVPRALHPLAFLAIPVKGEDIGGSGSGSRGRTGEKAVLEATVHRMSSSWSSFSSFKSRGYKAAAQCLSRCVDP